MSDRVVDGGNPAGARDYLLARWDLTVLSPGVVFAVTESGPVMIGKFDDHLLAADAVCSHNAILEVRPRG